MQFLGIDPSLRSTGWAVCRDGKIVRAGHIPTKGMDHPEAFGLIFRTIHRVAKELQAEDDVIAAVEDISLGYASSSGFTPTVEVSGVVKAAVSLAGVLAIVTVPAMTWKSIVLGSKNVRLKKISTGDREFYLKAVAAGIGFYSVVTDEADAAAIAWFADGLVRAWPEVRAESHRKIYESLTAQMAAALANKS